MPEKFSIKEAILFGWETVKNNLGFFVGVTLIYFLILYFPEIISRFIAPGAYILLNIILIPLYFLMYLGFIKITLNFCNKTKSEMVDLFSQHRLILKMLGACILYVLTVYLGIFLLIFPGIYLGIRLWFFDYFIVDKEIGVIESLKESWRVTKGNTWNLFVFFLALIGINILGALFLLIGLFVTIPISMVASAFAYYKLLEIQSQSDNLVRQEKNTS